MRPRDNHLADEELLRAIDRELVAPRDADVALHLARCEACRARYERLEEAAGVLAAAYRGDNEWHGSSTSAMRAALQSQLRDESDRWERSWRVRLASASATARQWTIPGAAVVAIGLLAGTLYSVAFDRSGTRGTEPDVLPMASLTPGATLNVSTAQICAAGTGGVGAIPAAMRQEVLRSYGMEGVPADEYELDYLITPQLGGATNARNLWPQRYGARTWNAHVKDQLEDLLPRMVCAQELDLETAQRDIAADWIAAYKKYFRTSDPLIHRTRTVARDDDKF